MKMSAVSFFDASLLSPFGFYSSSNRAYTDSPLYPTPFASVLAVIPFALNGLDHRRDDATRRMKELPGGEERDPAKKIDPRDDVVEQFSLARP